MNFDQWWQNFLKANDSTWFPGELAAREAWDASRWDLMRHLNEWIMEQYRADHLDKQKEDLAPPDPP